jgi:uncharacterized damage-inducible protein DinB
MPGVTESIRTAFDRNRALAERALDQLTDGELVAPGPGGANSVATIVWHMGANFESRFTDFLTTDGEKPWREREEEFLPRHVTRAVLVEKWNAGWACLHNAIDGLADIDLSRTIHIRHEPMTVADALHRSLAHAAYHIGQIVYIARGNRAEDWEWLSIAPGGTEEFNTKMAERWAAPSGQG